METFWVVGYLLLNSSPFWEVGEDWQSPPLSQGQVPVGLRGQGWGLGCVQGATSMPFLGPFAEPSAAGIHMLATDDRWRRHGSLPTRRTWSTQNEACREGKQKPPKLPRVQPVRMPELPGRTLTVCLPCTSPGCREGALGPTPVTGRSRAFHWETQPWGFTPVCTQ